ncbi:MAG: hydrogen gas-evolving membrane-bound hydrogenase subunit E [Chloroflexota bacterium]
MIGDRQLTVLLPLLAALGAAPLVALAGWWRPRWAAPASALGAGLALAAVLWGWGAGGGALDLPWAPTWNMRLSFALDGLAALYSLLATGIGLAVVLYSSGYLPAHLRHQHRPVAEETRFYFFVLLFMGAMVGLVMAQDLLLIFLFWDLTAVASYFLIGYDRQETESRLAAVMALLVTGITAVLFLIGTLLLRSAYGVFSLPELIARVEPGPLLTTAATLMAVAALAKSAQVPFHFWLPRAMAAPTPVSAYLHSAAMVAAGVFLLGRLYPLLARSPALLDGLLAVGMASMVVGGLLALTRDSMKQLLAYSTVAQYGYVVVLLGLGSVYGVLAASYYVLAHALAKSALFLTAGAVTASTGHTRLSSVGGLARDRPALAAGSALAAASLAGLPLTAGFFKDELFFAALLERGWGFALFAVLGAALTLTYSWRFWSGIFLGPRRSELRPSPSALTAPVLALGALTLAGGLVTAPFAGLAAAAAGVSLTGVAPAPSPSLAYHLDSRPENLMALATYALGGLLVYSFALWHGLADRLARTGEHWGPERLYRLTLAGLVRVSSLLHALEVRDLRERVTTVLVPTGLLVALAFVVTPTWNAYRLGDIITEELPLALMALIISVAALGTTLARNRLTLVLLLSGVGYSLAVIYAFLGAPDVALVAVLVETIFTLLLLGMLTLFSEELPLAAGAQPWGGQRWRGVTVALLAGVFALAVAWGTTSQPAPQSVAAAHIELTPSAHAKDVVTAILADFRGLDTLGEITVIGIATLGVATLLRRGRL